MAIGTDMVQGIEEDLLSQILSICLVSHPEHNIPLSKCSS